MLIEPYHPVFALLAFAAALLSSQVLLSRLPPPSGPGRFATIDGLRGYLAFAVFVHHASIWWGYAKTGYWALPPSALYTHFGQSGVALFFMITAFLFFGKLLDARARAEPVDWLRLYVSRVLRLVPLYLLVVGAMAVCALAATGWELQVPLRTLARTVAQWAFFTMLDEPTINGFADTHFIVAGVVWSLPYEWTFYLVLPLMALALRQRVAWPWALMALAIGIWSWRTFWQPIHLLAFAEGMVAAWLARQQWLRPWAEHPAAGAMALGSLWLAVWLSPDPRQPLVVALLTVSFCLIAAGNSLFGLLKLQASKRLGDVAYGLYLLHGLVLFVGVRFVVGTERTAALSPWGHWALMLVFTPVLIGLAGLGYVAVERPALKLAAGWTRTLRNALRRAHPSA